MAEYIKTLLRNWFSWDVGQETPKPKEEDNKDGAQVPNEVAQQQVQTEETQQVQTEETQQETQQVQIEETQQVQIEDSKQALIEEAQGAQNEEIKIENDPVPVPVRRSESQQINLVDANIAKYGSKKVKAVRHSAALTANDLEGAGAQVGLEIWRVENTAEKFVRRWPTNLFGQFFSSDSYLVLNTYKVADSDTLHHDLHFWIGKESPQAELGVAAYKTAELDDLLREIPILHRELQGHESNLFRSYFTKIGLMILKGAYTTGFSQMKYEEFGSYKRLFMIKREIKGWKVKTGVTFEIPCLATNMNHGDVFALDLGSRVYLWIGKQASTFEKFEGNVIANNIVNSRNGRARRVPIDDLFWEALEGTESDVRSEENPYEVDMSGEDWLDQENVKLFRISEVSGIPKFTLEAKRKVSIKALDSNDVFLIHANVGVWIWEGSNATKQEKEKAFLLADNYMTEYNLPSHLPVTKITEDQAKYSPLFHSLFVDAK